MNIGCGGKDLFDVLGQDIHSDVGCDLMLLESDLLRIPSEPRLAAAPNVNSNQALVPGTSPDWPRFLKRCAFSDILALVAQEGRECSDDGR